MALTNKQLFSVLVVVVGGGVLFLTDQMALGPGGAEKAYQRGIEYAKDSSKTDLAIRQYDLAIQRDPAMTKAYFERGYQKQRINRIDEALIDYNTVIRLDPNDVVAYYDRGLIYRDLGEPQKALTDFSAAIGQKSPQAKYYYERAAVYQEAGDFDHALADYDAVVAQFPRDTNAYYGRSRLRADNGDFDGAIADLDQVVAIVPDLFVTYLERGRLRRAKGDAAAALEDFNTAIKLKTDHPQLYIERGITYRDRGEIDKARSELDAVIKRFPDNAAAYMHRGLIALFLLDQPAAAVKDFTSAINYGSFYRHLATLYVEAIRYPDVEGMGRQLLAPNVPFLPTIYYLAIWRHIAQVHSVQDDKAEFASFAMLWDINDKLAFDKPTQESRPPRRAYWPSHIIGLHLGLTTPDVVRQAAATTPGSYKRRLRGCEAGFYLAEHQLEKQMMEDARKMLQTAADNCPASAPESSFAKSELKRLQSTQKR